MGGNKKSTAANKKAMIAALEQSLGVVTTAAKTAGISREAHRQWMIKDQKYAMAVADIEEISLDFGESMLHKRMKDGDTAATIFYLKTKGKRRGYVERNEVDFSAAEGTRIVISNTVVRRGTVNEEGSASVVSE